MKGFEGIPESPFVNRLIDLGFDISDRIYAVMQEKGISQRQLAELTGKKESQVSRWLSGSHNFTLKTIARLEIALGEPIISVTGAGEKDVSEAQSAHEFHAEVAHGDHFK